MLKERKTDNFSMRVYLETIESIVGAHGLKSILNYAHLQTYINRFPPLNNRHEILLEDLQNLCRSLLELFGKKGIRSLQLQVGRQIIRKSLEKRSPLLRAAFFLRFLIPESILLKGALRRLIQVVNKRYPSNLDIDFVARLELQEEKDCFLIIYRDNWESEDVMSPSPVCHVTVGAISAFVEWVTQHVYDVKETECRAMGHPADVFRISKSYRREWIKKEVEPPPTVCDSTFRYRSP